MDFNVGDRVVMQAHGVGQIAQIAEHNFNGRGPTWYYEVVTARGTIWVAVNGSNTSGLRQLTDRADLARYRGLLQSQPAPVNADPLQRKSEMAQRLRQGSLQVICEVVRDLNALRWRRPLGEADSALLRRAQDGLAEEWASAAGIPRAEADQEINDLLQAARSLYEQ